MSERNPHSCQDEHKKTCSHDDHHHHHHDHDHDHEHDEGGEEKTLYPYIDTTKVIWYYILIVY